MNTFQDQLHLISVQQEYSENTGDGRVMLYCAACRTRTYCKDMSMRTLLMGSSRHVRICPKRSLGTHS